MNALNRDESTIFYHDHATTNTLVKKVITKNKAFFNLYKELDEKNNDQEEYFDLKK